MALCHPSLESPSAESVWNHFGQQGSHTHTHTTILHVTILIKVTLQATNPPCEIMSVLFASAVVDLGHSQENLAH